MDSVEFRHGDLTRGIIGVYFCTYNELGHGFVESVGQNAMAIALIQAGFKIQCNVPLTVRFRGQQVGLFRADIVVDNAVLLELKAVLSLEPWHEAQVLNYLRASELEVALLFNFGPKPEFKRLVLANSRKRPPAERGDVR